MDVKKRDADRKGTKRPYRKPKVSVYGEIADLTLGGGGSQVDGKDKPSHA